MRHHAQRRHAAQAQRVTIGRCFRDKLVGDGAAGAETRLYHHRLAERLGQFLCGETRAVIERPAGRGAGDDAYGFDRVIRRAILREGGCDQRG